MSECNDPGVFCAIVGTPGLCGLDFETTMARLYDREICTIQVSHVDGRSSVLHLWSHPEWLPIVRAALRASPCQFVAHFAIFETEILMKFDLLPPSYIECTFIAARVLRGVVPGNDIDPDYSLAGLMLNELGVVISKDTRSRDWREPLDDEAITYCLGDTESARDLWMLFNSEMADEPWQRRGYEIIRDALPAIAECNLTGLEFDHTAHDKLCAAKAEDADRLAFELDLLAPGLNPNSPKQVSMWISERLVFEAGASAQRASLVYASVTGEAAWKLTASGQLMLGKAYLGSLLGTLEAVAYDEDLIPEAREPWAEIVQMIRLRLGYNKHAKILQAFGPSLRNQVDADGCIRTSLIPHGARTSRQSARSPNLQNQPNETVFRRVYKKRKKRKLVQADYSQIELRVGSIEADDAAMQEVFRRGLDIHTATACAIHHIPIEAFDKNRSDHKTWRTNGKPVTFAALYGAMVATIALNSGLPVAEAEQLLYAWLQVYPGIARYRETYPDKARALGYVELVSGQRIKVRSDSRTPQLINAPVQGSAASVMYLAMTRVYDRLKASGIDARLALCVHDEILIDAAEDCAYDAAIILQECMTEALVELYPMTVDMGIANVADAVILDTWGDKESDAVAPDDYISGWLMAA